MKNPKTVKILQIKERLNYSSKMSNTFQRETVIFLGCGGSAATSYNTHDTVHNFDTSSDKYYPCVKLQCLVSRTTDNISQRFMAIVYQMFYQGKN